MAVSTLLYGCDSLVKKTKDACKIQEAEKKFKEVSRAVQG
jgi:hypothetical protein